MNPLFVTSVALSGGALLAVMIALNSQFAGYVSPVYASWLAHGTGAITALIIVQLMRRIQSAEINDSHDASPVWSYLGGIPGAFVVVLAVITVNSPLGLTGTLVLGITGQIIFGLITDHWGWFGMLKRELTWQRFVATLLIFSGSLLIVLAKGALV